MNNRKVERISPPSGRVERAQSALGLRWNNVLTLGLVWARVAAPGSKGIESKPSVGQRPPRLRRPLSPPSTRVYESQSGASRASRASTTTARLQLTPPQPRVADGATPTSTSTPVCKEEVRETGGGAEDRCRGPDVPRRSHMKENTGGERKDGSREGRETEKPGQKHRSKHLEIISDHTETPVRGGKQDEAAC